MVKTFVLNRSEIADAMLFYDTHAPYGLLYPKDLQWIQGHLGTDFFLIGVRICGELVGIRWIALKPNFIYFIIDDSHITLKNDGFYTEIGGECIRSDYRGSGIVQLLTSTSIIFWFAEKESASPLWTRVTGQKDIEGNPLFWSKVGVKITGISYRELLSLQFGSMEKVIFENWPSRPMLLKDIPPELLKETLGKPLDSLVRYQDRFISWGYELTERYVPTSLNRFMRVTKENVREPEKLYNEGLNKVSRIL